MTTDPWIERDELQQELLLCIANPTRLTDEVFNDLLRRISNNQAARSPFLRRYLEHARRTSPYPSPAGVPPVPTAAFRGRLIVPIPSPTRVFHTSGTTGAETGLHGFLDTTLYDTAAPITFSQHVLGPELLAPDAPSLRFVHLLPHPASAPHSSLVHMMDLVSRKFSNLPAVYLAQPGPVIPPDAPHQLDLLLAESPNPVVLSGPAFAFVQLLEHAGITSPFLPSNAPRWPLPPGSRIMETGGFKGRTREIQRHQFHLALSDYFALPIHSIINEYGMTELTSQFYDRTLLIGQNTPDKTSSPWLRANPVNPVSGEPMPPGQPGALRVWDLLNLDSAVVIQTEDMAVANEDGTFRLLGRVPKSMPRGCSLPFG